MAVETVAAFLAEVRQGQVLEPAQLEELAREARGTSDPRALGKFCMKKGWLTPFQVSRMLHGVGSTLAMGQYRILELLGEGGMGQVFKARHQAMGRIVALKVIRRDRLNNEKAVKRFRREIQVAASLTHPNVVMAFDADAVGGQHFIAMEFVDGLDLSRLVKEKGPLPIPQACDFIRQAALGLQHAHERGLVHRDIKPSNLLVARPNPNGDARSAGSSGVLRRSNRPQIKILDMGLARLLFDSDDAATGVTQDGLVVGTPDYMSPEQGKNSHLVDHRADIYSLGCTLYYLLSGQVPFPGGTNIEKLVKHQVDQPRPIEQIRGDIPEGLRTLVRRMMAKKPDDRPQTGNEVATLLTPFCEPSGKTAGRDSKRMPLPAAGLVAPPRRGGWSRVKRGAGTSFSVVRGLFSRNPARRKRSRRQLAAVALGLAVLVAGFFYVRSQFTAGEPTSTPVAASTQQTPAGTTPTPPVTRLDPQSVSVPSRFFPQATQLAVGVNLNILRASPLYIALFQRDLRTWRNQMEQYLGLDLHLEVEQAVVCTVQGSSGEQRAAILHGMFETQRFRNHMQQSGAPLLAENWYFLADRSYVIMPSANIVVWTNSEALMRDIGSRIQATSPPPLADPAIQRHFESWDLPAARVVLGGTYPTGQSAPADRFAGLGLQELDLEINLNNDSGTARLSAQTGSADAAQAYQRQLPLYLAEYASRDNGYSALLKALLDSPSAITPDHSVVWQLSVPRGEITSYFYRRKQS